MKKVSPPRANTLIMLYRNPKTFSLFDKYYIAPHGYSLVIVEQGHDIYILPPVGGRVAKSKRLYLIKESFDMTWGVGKLICTLENNVLSDEYGISGTVYFNIESLDTFFTKIGASNKRRVSVDDFKRIWLRHGSDLLKRTFSDDTISYRQAPHIVKRLKNTISDEMIKNYGVAVMEININDTNKI